MKIKFILVLFSSLIYVISVTAQVSAEFSINNVFSTQNKPAVNNPTARSLQSGQRRFGAIAGLNASALTNALPLSAQSANCLDSNGLFAPVAAPCNGVSVTSINFNNASKTIFSGTDNTVGVVYRYSNAGTAPDGTALDALVTVNSYSNNQDADQTNFSNADVPVATAGFDQNLQPDINQESAVFTNASSWAGNITYRIRFVIAGTSTPKIITVAATTIDNDGSNGAVCGASLRESVTYSTALNQVLTSSSTNQTISGNTVTGPAVNQALIGTGINYANAALYINVSEINWTYSFATTTTPTCAAGTASAARLGSLNLSCQINFGRNFASVPVSGTVYNDSNGLTDLTVNGTGTGTPSGTQLYANLLDSSDNVVSVVTVAANGTYTFPVVVAGTYNIQITTNQGTESSPAPATALPISWRNTGENLGAAAGNDGTANGRLQLTVAAAAITNANFGIRQNPTAANGNISGTLYSSGNPIPNSLVVLIDAERNLRTFTRTDADGHYLFSDKEVGRTYIIQPLSVKYSFSPAVGIANLLDNVTGLNFNSSAKTYRPRNDFDGDGQSDVAVFRPADGNWYVLRSSDGQLSVFKFGVETDVPVSADFDGDGKTDYAVFRPSEGIWYIWQSKTQDLRVERFGSVDDKLVAADYDGDGRADVAVYRNGIWYIRRSSDDLFEAKTYGADADTPVAGDFDGDGKADFSVYRPADGNWFTLHSSNNNSSARRFGLATDVPISGDFDGDGFDDIAQFRNGFWYVLNSTTGFEAIQFEAGEHQPIVGDYDGDGRADATVFRNGLWSIRNSGDGTVRSVYFGLPTDILVK